MNSPASSNIEFYTQPLGSNQGEKQYNKTGWKAYPDSNGSTSKSMLEMKDSTATSSSGKSRLQAYAY